MRGVRHAQVLRRLGLGPALRLDVIGQSDHEISPGFQDGGLFRCVSDRTPSCVECLSDSRH